MIDIENWNWAVWAVLALYAFNIFMAPFLHGKKRDPWNGFNVMFGTAISATLLFFGGFFA